MIRFFVIWALLWFVSLVVFCIVDLTDPKVENRYVTLSKFLEYAFLSIFMWAITIPVNIVILIFRNWYNANKDNRLFDFSGKKRMLNEQNRANYGTK